MSQKLNTSQVIAKKRDGLDLSKDDIESVIRGIVSGDVQNSQLGAFLMATFIKGMSLPETVNMTRAMVNSGDTLQWPEEWRGSIVDKHSTGGVGDKISLPLAPALAACGMKVPMISGRGLGHTGGTLDKLESIPGFQVNVSPERMSEILEDVGCCIVGQTSSLVPADRIMYATRDVTGTVESVPLIASSIVSKKIAENLDALVLDIKSGGASTLKTIGDARELANWMVGICVGNGIKTSAIITQMDDPLGLTIGNSLEIVETLHCLHGDGPVDIQELVFELGGQLLFLAGKVDSEEDGVQRIREVIRSGQAMEKFCQMLKAQEVDAEVADKLCDIKTDVFSILRPSKTVTELKCMEEGYIHRIDALSLASVSCELGAGRTKSGEPVNHAVGLQLALHVGSHARPGDVWVRVHHDQQTLSNVFVQRLQGSLTVTPERVGLDKLSRIIEVVKGPNPEEQCKN